MLLTARDRGRPLGRPNSGVGNELNPAAKEARPTGSQPLIAKAVGFIENETER